MSIDIRLPNITATTDAGKLQQIHSYMYQLVGQLNWALNNLNNTSPTVAVKSVTDASTTSKDDPLSNFNSIKGLIIKSADIVKAYYEEIDSLMKLSGEYVAEATFPDGSAKFVENTNLKVNANSQYIDQIFTDIQTVNTNLTSVSNKLQQIDVTANIRSGLLYYDTSGVPVFGLEVGQRTDVNGTEVFNKYARFTANKLSFYDVNDNEVAYISDYKLYITHVEIKGSFKEGGYMDIIGDDGGIVTKWVGGV